MRIKKIFNNSVVSAIKDTGEEVIVMGQGIGFSKKKGDIIPKHSIEKIFIMDHKSNDKFKQLLEDVSYEYLKISDKIIHMAQEQIGKHFSEKIYITLTDHISYAVERFQQNIEIRNALLYEIKNFYAQEFSAAQQALILIEQEFGIALPEDEAGFIALHFVNAELDSSMEHMEDLTVLVKNIVDIVKYYFKREFDEQSLVYSRFVTHLRYLGKRVFSGELLEHNDIELQAVVRKNYPEASLCAEKIAEFIKNQFQVEISEDDKLYLTVHLQRLTG